MQSFTSLVMHIHNQLISEYARNTTNIDMFSQIQGPNVLPDAPTWNTSLELTRDG